MWRAAKRTSDRSRRSLQQRVEDMSSSLKDEDMVTLTRYIQCWQTLPSNPVSEEGMLARPVPPPGGTE